MCLGLLVACTKSSASVRSEEFSECAASTVAAHDDPQDAFSAYVEALNRADFCESIRFYDETDRVEAALVAFRALVIAAGGQSSRQADYAARFSELCQRYGLDYSDQSAFVGLFLSLLNDDDWKSDIPNVRRLAEKDPASFYAQTMRRLHSVQPSAAVKISPILNGLSFGADVATANANRSDGQSVVVAFKQTPRGWILTFSDQLL